MASLEGDLSDAGAHRPGADDADRGSPLRHSASVRHRPLVGGSPAAQTLAMGPETRYLLTADGVHIGYQVVGGGPVDLVYQSGWVSNVDLWWDMPGSGDFLRQLSRRGRLILFDRRGSGVSDRPSTVDALSLELAVDDTLAILDEIGSKRAILIGFEDGSVVNALLAASHPERVSGLIMYAPWVAYWRDDDYPWGYSSVDAAESIEWTDRHWGTDAFARWNLEDIIPAEQLTAEFIGRWSRYWRLCVSPAGAVAIERMQQGVDVRSILPTIRVPTLVMHREGDAHMYQGGAWIASRIPGARFARLPGAEHPPFLGDTRSLLAELDRFVAGLRAEEADLDRVLATVLFVDLVASTDLVAAGGDAAWRATLEQYRDLVRGLLARFRGIEVDSVGDGLFATFDGPARAVRCATAIVTSVPALGLEARAGCHAGEVATVDGRAGGIAVHIGARVGTIAGPGEVLVSSTVKDLAAGSGLSFEDAGEHELKGVPDRWRLYRVAG
jgi:pimeloyl-ACP methyl ester carboxylesterase